jgi:hypothetical protein
MIPSSKSKESVTPRVVPPPTGARTAGKGVPSPAKSEPAQKFMVWPEDRLERIAVKAHELWEQRGCRQGYDLEDWLDAEAVARKEIREARE